MPLIDDFAELNQRITFNSKQTVKVNGVATEKDVVVATIWAAVKTERLTERMANIGNEVTNVITFVIREQQDFEVDSKMTISWSGDSYQVININHDTANKIWLTIICEVITA